MEFLVRLENKVNTQVFCTNPLHKDRVVYNDPTFEAVCPKCSSKDFLYRKNNAITKKGHFITYKPDGWSWGRLELKHYGIVRINCTDEEAKTYCESVGDPKDIINYRPRKNKFDFEKELTDTQFKDWIDLRKYSPVVTICDTINIKEVI